MNRLGYDVFSFGNIYRYGLYSEDVIYSGCYVEFQYIQDAFYVFMNAIYNLDNISTAKILYFRI